jgi:inhibitor of KinA sporulation pathway (predicted exonuclease)
MSTLHIIMLVTLIVLVVSKIVLNKLTYKSQYKSQYKIPTKILKAFVSECQKSAQIVLAKTPTSIGFQKFDQQAVLLCAAKLTMPKSQFCEYVEKIMLDQFMTIFYKMVISLPKKLTDQSKDELDMVTLEWAMDTAKNFDMQWWELFHFLKDFTGPALRSWVDANKEELVKGKDLVQPFISVYKDSVTSLVGEDGGKTKETKVKRQDGQPEKKGEHVIKVDQVNGSWTQILFLLPSLFKYGTSCTTRQDMLELFYIEIGKFCKIEHDTNFYKKLASHKKMRNFLTGKLEKYKECEFFSKVKSQMIIELSKSCKELIEKSVSGITVRANFKATCDEFTIFVDELDTDKFDTKITETKIEELKLIVTKFESLIFKEMGLPPFTRPLFTFEIVEI